MQIKSKCPYCGVTELIHVQFENDLKDLRCYHCDHHTLQFERLAPHDNIDYYVGCPPFPEKPKPEPVPEPDPSTQLEKFDFSDYGFDGFYDMSYGEAD